MGNLHIPTVVVLDSGIGGVAVLNRLIKNHIKVNYIYIADNDFMPYGSKTKEVIKNRAEFLLEYIFKTYNPNLVIIACNTMSTSVGEIINEKVVCMKFNKNKLYLATRLTKKNLKGYKVVSDNSLASLIEENLVNKSRIAKIIGTHINKRGLKNTKQLTLGCTHYELCKDIFESKIDGKVDCNSEPIVNEIKEKLKGYQTQKDINIVIETTRKSVRDYEKIRLLIGLEINSF